MIKLLFHFPDANTMVVTAKEEILTSKSGFWVVTNVTNYSGLQGQNHRLLGTQFILKNPNYLNCIVENWTSSISTESSIIPWQVPHVHTTQAILPFSSASSYLYPSFPDFPTFCYFWLSFQRKSSVFWTSIHFLAEMTCLNLTSVSQLQVLLHISLVIS